MMYKIGEISEMLGLSSQGIRFYEQEGILDTYQEEQTRHRLYSNTSLQVLGAAMRYRGWDFSVQDAARLLKCSSSQDICRELKQQSQSLQEQMKWMQLKIRSLERWQELLDGIEEKVGQYELVNCPDVHVLITGKGREIFRDEDSLHAFRESMQLMPLVMSGNIISPEETGSEGEDFRKCHILWTEDWQELNLAKELPFFRYPSTVCLHTVLRHGEQRYTSAQVSPLVERCREMGLKPAGDILLMNTAIYRREQSYMGYQYFSHNWLPVTK